MKLVSRVQSKHQSGCEIKIVMKFANVPNRPSQYISFPLTLSSLCAKRNTNIVGDEQTGFSTVREAITIDGEQHRQYRCSRVCFEGSRLTIAPVFTI